jgi:hypothetical protein
LAYTLINISKPETANKKSYWKLWVAGVFVVVVLCVLKWGGYVLVARNSLPNHVDATVILQGPIATEKARIAAAMVLLQHGSTDRVALSIPKESDWGEQIAPVVRQYLEKNYGAELAGRVDFCETSGDMNSIEQEAQVLGACVQQHQWKTIVLVTSNYQSRRAGIIWRKTLPTRDSSIQVAVDGVADSEYQPRRWWRQPDSARIWLVEFAKLVRAI